MDDSTTAALNRGGVADIITAGRKSGQPRRTEIYFHQFDGRYFITGKPGPRDWVANLKADPRFVLHLQLGPVAEVPATAELVTDVAERERIIWRCLTESWGRGERTARTEMPDRVANGLLIEFTVA
jgi:deazaflavin-dependent oxidoreductase (nitroreductase family)